MRRAVEAMPFADVGAITLSAGVCSRGHDHDAHQLVKFADRALYWAKEHGRNITSVYGDEAHAVNLVVEDGHA